jgi:hypothetical protein
MENWGFLNTTVVFLLKNDEIWVFFPKSQKNFFWPMFFCEIFVGPGGEIEKESKSEQLMCKSR